MKSEQTLYTELANSVTQNIIVASPPSQRVGPVQEYHLRYVLGKYKARENKSWQFPLGLIAGLAPLFFTTEKFQDAFGIDAKSAKAVIVCGILVCLFFVLKGIWKACNVMSIDDVVNELMIVEKEEAEGSQQESARQPKQMPKRNVQHSGRRNSQRRNNN